MFDLFSASTTKNIAIRPLKVCLRWAQWRNNLQTGKSGEVLSPKESWKQRNHNRGLEKRDWYHILQGPSTVPVHSRNQGDGITVNKGRGTTWATTMPPPRVKFAQLHAECYDTYLTVTPEQFACKLYGRNICRKYQKNKNIRGLISCNTPHKCQHNLITIVNTT